MIFDQIECDLPRVKSVEEIRFVCRVLQALIHNHGQEENDLAYIALDHILKERNQHTRLYHDHQEVDGLLKELEEITDLPKARIRLKAALDACRAHFNEEERNVFPLIEKALQPQTLAVLGRAWKPLAHGDVPPPKPRH